MLEDFINFTQEKCKSLILEYQETEDSHIFSLLLAKYDRYILSVIYALRSKCHSLQIESLQELYHTSIIGFEKGLRSFKPDSPSKYICHHIESYVKSELKQTYFETKTDKLILQIDVNEDKKEEFEKIRDRLSAKFLVEDFILTKKERKMLKMRFINDHNLVTIAKKMNCHHATVTVNLKKILGKLKKAIKDNSGC